MNIGIRLLSCETPDEYGAIVFQDNIVHGAVIGINFFIRDLYARGFQKKYSLAVIIDDDNDSMLQTANCSAGDDLVANTENVISLLDSIVRAIKYDYEKGEEIDTANSSISKSSPSYCFWYTCTCILFHLDCVNFKLTL